MPGPRVIHGAGRHFRRAARPRGDEYHHGLMSNPAPDDLHARLRALEAENERLRTSAEHAESDLRRLQSEGRLGFYDIDLASDDFHALPETRRIYGLPATGRLRGTDIQALVLPEDRHLVSTREDRDAGKAPRDVEARIRRADDGEIRWIARSGEFEYGDGGRPVRFMGVVRDITERKQIRQALDDERALAQTALAASQARYRALLESIDAAFCVVHVIVDADGRPMDLRYLETNAVFERHTGMKDVTGRTLREMVPGIEPYWIDFYAEIARTGQARRTTQEIASVGRWLEIHAYPFGDPHARQVAVLFNDVSEQQRSLRRQAALLALGDRLGPLADPAAIEQAGCEELARALGADHVTYAAADAEREDIEVADTLVAVPLLDRGRVVARLHVRHAAPRAWDVAELAFIRDVGERVRFAAERARGERALRDSEEQFRVFAQAVPNMVWAARPDGTIDWLNDEVAAYSGRSAREVLGPEGWASIVHPDDLAAAQATWRRSLEAGDDYEIEFRIRRADGRYRWFLVRAQAVRASDAAIVRWVGTNTDIDDQRQQAQKLEWLVAERTADRNALWQLTSDVMLRATFDGLVTAANPAWTEVLGWPLTAIVGSNLFDLLHPDDLDRTRTVAAQLSLGGPLDRFDNRYRHQDGSWRWISWSARPGQGLINAVGRDITADKERAEALRDLEDFSRLALSAVGGVGVWRYDVASDRFFCDESIANLYGIDVAQGAAGILREDFLANVVPEDMAALRATMSGGLVRSGDLELEYRIRHPDGSTRWVLSRGHTYFDAAGQPVRRTGVGVEMTRQRQLEEQLRQSQKLEAVGQLTGGIAHDFNNMLSTISTSLELLKLRAGTGTKAELERYIGLATKAIRGAASLTQRLLAFSRKQTLDIRAVDVNRLARDLEDLLRRTLGERISLALALGDDPWTAHTDANQLESALLNLAINARDAMPEGGKLTIETTNLNVGAGTAVAADLVPGDYLVVSVSDTGTGMPPDVVRRAFDPFFTTKPIGQGTGLGLSMIYGYARQSGGNVTIYSRPGDGTTVKIFLPRSLAVEAPAAAAVAAPAARGDGERILLVEDEDDVREVVREVLVLQGYVVTTAHDAVSALAILRERDPVDLLVTDVGLPGETGRTLASKAQALRPGLRVLFITGYAKEAAVRSEFLGEGMDMLSKPFAVDDLVARVHALTRR